MTGSSYLLESNRNGVHLNIAVEIFGIFYLFFYNIYIKKEYQSFLNM